MDSLSGVNSHGIGLILKHSVGRVSKKMSSYQYSDPNFKDKMLSWQSYL